MASMLHEGNDMRISPDGTKVAYVAADELIVFDVPAEFAP
jgi:hypothetical protein